MKQIFITFVLAMSILGLQAQTKTTYYKSLAFDKVVPESKAKYKSVIVLKKDTVVARFYKIKGNRFLFNIETLNGTPTGIWYKYGKYGSVIYRKDFNELVYSDDSIRDLHKVNKHDPKYKSFKPPLFPGGTQELMQFLETHIHYPEASKELHHSGTVFIRFYVKEDGTVVPYSIMKGVDPFIDLEAWEVIKEMPKWIPAEMDGKPVRTIFNIPIKFKL